MPDVDTLTQLKATTPERLSVQSRAADSPFAPTSDVSGAGLFWVQLGNQLDEEPQWNAIYPHWRDIYLQRFARQEPMLASAVYSMATRISTSTASRRFGPRRRGARGAVVQRHPDTARWRAWQSGSNSSLDR